MDETAFVRQMLSDLGKTATINPKRIFAAGYSNGAMVVYRLACEMSDTFAAIAPVVGVLFFEPCQPKQPVSVMAVQGMNDTVVPYEGGKSDLEDAGWVSPGFRLPSVDQSIATWVKLDGCTGSPVEEKQGLITRLLQ